VAEKEVMEAFLFQTESRNVDVTLHVQTDSTSSEMKDENDHVYVLLDYLELSVYLG
jgi:hypothetical protein